MIFPSLLQIFKQVHSYAHFPTKPGTNFPISLLKYYTRDLQEVFIVTPVDSVYQDLGGDHNSVPEDCKCAGEHSEHLLDVHGSVPDNRYAQKSSISRSHFGEGGGQVYTWPSPLRRSLVWNFKWAKVIFFGGSHNKHKMNFLRK